MVADSIVDMVADESLTNVGVVDSKMDAVIMAESVVNMGDVSAYVGVDMVGDEIENYADIRTVIGDVDLVANTKIDHAFGTVQSMYGDIYLESDEVSIADGVVVTNGDIAVKSTRFLNDRGMVLGDFVQVQGAEVLDNAAGSLIGLSGLSIDAGEQAFSIRNGTLSWGGYLGISAGSMTNEDEIRAGVIDIAFSKRFENKGALIADQLVSIVAKGGLDNTVGRLDGEALHINVEDNLFAFEGEMAWDDLTIQARQIHNWRDLYGRNIRLDLADAITNDWALSAKQELVVKSDGHLVNNGTISGELVRVKGEGIANQSGSILADGLYLDMGDGQDFDVKNGILGWDSYLGIKARSFQHDTEIVADAIDFELSGRLDNTGRLVASEHLSVVAKNGVSNVGGAMVSDGGLHIDVADNTFVFEGEQQ